MASRKLVLFGAGKIGRSFIGQLFSQGGYEVVFVDVDQKMIDLLNTYKKYRVAVKSDLEEWDIWVNNVRAVSAYDKRATPNEIATADILAIAVGQNALPKIAPVIAAGLELRVTIKSPNPLDIILAENLKDAAELMETELKKHLPLSFDLDMNVGLVETSIGKMVPIMPAAVLKDDPLVVYAEPYNTLIVDRKGFKNPIPDIKGLAPKDHISAWVDRKLYIHNLGHAAVAYYGYIKFPELKHIHELIGYREVYDAARSAMLQAAEALLKCYPEEFTRVELKEQIEDLLQRFANKALGDTVFRVGQDLYRKLGPEDRLVGAMKMAIKYDLPYDKILQVIVCALNFDATDENGNRSDSDKEFSKEAAKGISHILESVCEIDLKKHSKIHEIANSIKI